MDYKISTLICCVPNSSSAKAIEEKNETQRDEKINLKEDSQQKSLFTTKSDGIQLSGESDKSISQQQRCSLPELTADEQIPYKINSSSEHLQLLSNTNSDFSHNFTERDGLRSSSNVELSEVPNTDSPIKNITEEVNIQTPSVISNDTLSNGSGTSSTQCEKKRALQKHQRPLTRYLPIFSTDLNLRQHIEAAGHQITLCPHVFVDAYSCRGYLHKLGATFHGWSRRWFVLDRQRSALIYYSDKSERKPRGGAYFSTIDEVYLDHLNASKSGRPHCTFIVKTKKRSYHLQAASDAAARIWIDSIITGAQGNMDY